MIFIYNALSILLVGYVLGKKLEKNKIKRKYLFFCFFQMFLIQGLRSIDVGADTVYYVSIYENFTNSEYYGYLFTHYEPGFQAIYYLMKSLNADAQVLLMLISAITMFNFAHFIYKNSENVWISTFIFATMFYPNSFNIMRQYMAISIALYSVEYFLNKNYIKASIPVLFSALFHSTPILLFLPMILYKIKNWKVVRNAILLMCGVFFVFGEPIVKFLLELVGKSFYIRSGLYDVNEFFRMTTMLTLLFSLLSWYFIQKNKDREYSDLFNLFSGIAFMNLACGVLYLRYEFFSRVIELLNLFLIISVPMALRHIRSYYRPLIRLGAFVLPFLLMLNAVYNSGSGVENYTMFFMN